MLQLHRGENRAEAASWDGLHWEGCERCALPVSGHWWQGGRLHSPRRPGAQGRGKRKKKFYRKSPNGITNKLLQISPNSYSLFMTIDLIVPWFFPCPGPGLLCHRSVGPLCAASTWGVWRWYRTGQLPEVWGSSLLRWPPRCLLRCQRQTGPDDAWQNGWSHQVRHTAQRSE